MKSTVVTVIAQLMLVQHAASFAIVPQGAARTKKSLPLTMTLRDEYMRPHFHPPATATTAVDTDMSHIVECADGSGQCSVEEMTSMVEELDRMNESCKNHDSGAQECSLDIMDARETIQHALKTQIELSEARKEMKNMDVIQSWSHGNTDEHATTVEDHSFDHFVDYRAIGEYESH